MSLMKRKVLTKKKWWNKHQWGLFVLVALWGCTSKQNPQVTLQTSLGEIVVEVFADKAPVTAQNFISLVDAGVYSNGKFYRVVRMDNQPHNSEKIEVIQGGLLTDSVINTFPAIKHETTKETGILHKDGVVSMARLEPGTASTEIFICIGDQPSLDYGGKRNKDGQGFAAFGKVIKGMDVVKKIQMHKDTAQMLKQTIPFRAVKSE